MTIITLAQFQLISDALPEGWVAGFVNDEGEAVLTLDEGTARHYLPNVDFGALVADVVGRTLDEIKADGQPVDPEDSDDLDARVEALEEIVAVLMANHRQPNTEEAIVDLVNNATETTLRDAGLNRTTALRVINERPIASYEELDAIRGMGATALQRITDFVKRD